MSQKFAFTDPQHNFSKVGDCAGTSEICKLNEEKIFQLNDDKIRKFVSLSTDGLLNHYEPTFKNIQKDLGKRFVM